MEQFTILKMTNLSKLRYKITALPMGVLTRVVLVFWNGSERMLGQNILELMWKNTAQEHKKHKNEEWGQRTCVTRQQNASPGHCHQTLWPGLGPWQSGKCDTSSPGTDPRTRVNWIQDWGGASMWRTSVAHDHVALAWLLIHLGKNYS